MQFDVLTLFPDMFFPVLGESIVGRAAEAEKIKLRVIDIRDFSLDKHKKADDYPYGGGTGLVMTPQPLYDAWLSLNVKGNSATRTIYMSPQGKKLTQKRAIEFAASLQRLVIICGHYEGIDERVIELIADEELSIGDYVLTGGEIPAMALIDCVSRLVPGVLPSEEAYKNDSHFDGMLEYPQYTRPSVFMGRRVPSVLLSGDHAKIQQWRVERSIERTKEKRPDLMSSPSRRLALKGALNARDMGGYPAINGMVTRFRTFMRADLLTDLTRHDIDTLLSMGLTTVIDLRSKSESEREPEPFDAADGLALHNVQLLPESVIDRAIADEPFRELYIKFAERGKTKIARVFKLMANAPGLCLFHCHAGKDRTGIIAALLLLLAGVSKNDVVADYEVSGTYFRPKLFGAIDNVTGLPVSDYIRSDVGTIEYFMCHVEDKYGGAEAYLTDAGLSDSDIHRIRSKFLAVSQRDAKELGTDPY